MEIYSVESRKGGVGKTTIALNLAKALVDREYDVVLIDCDITGTPITEASCHSYFWRDIVKPISLGDEEENLIRYFENVYLKGGVLDSGTATKMTLEKGKVHLIGSEIYDNNGKLIIDPRLLMDDLHSHWFVEMIREIVERFEGVSDSEKKAIILDNSPGYVGIGKSIREWLTSIGPDIAHFLLVSSLDEQDIDSTVNSVMEIERTMNNKWRIAKLHNELVHNNGTFDGLQQILSNNHEFEGFFYSLQDVPYTSKLEKEPNVQDYVSIVLNKVPVIYHDANIRYRIKENDSPERKKMIDALIPFDVKGMPMNIIEYDASISGQFIESSISSSVAGEEQSQALDNVCNLFLQKMGRYEESKDKVKQSSSLNNSFDRFQKDLIKLGYKPLIDSLGEDLVNLHYIKDIIAFVRSLGNVAIPDFDVALFKADDVQKKDKQLLTKFIEEHDLLKYSSALYSLFDNIYKKAGFSKKTANKYLLVNLSLLFQAFLEVQKSQYKGKETYHLQLMQGYNDKTISEGAVNGALWGTITLHNKTFKLSGNAVDNLFKNYFVEFYQKMCYTLLRLVDCSEDYRVIMEACRATISRGSRTMDGDVRAYVRSVVSWKTVEFRQDLFKTLIDKSFEMKVVKDAISKMVLDRK